jgi:hypothetical protein
MAKIIKLTESDLIKMVNRIISEQPDTILSKFDVVRYIENKMNDEIIPNKQTELLNAYTIRVEQGPDDTYVVVIKGNQDGEVVEADVPLTSSGNYIYTGDISGKFSLGKVSMAFAVDILREDPKLQKFFEDNPRFVEKIKNSEVDATIRTNSQDGGIFKLFFTQKPDRASAKQAIPAGDEYPLGEYFDRNKLPMKVNNSLYAHLESGGLMLKLTDFWIMEDPAMSSPTPETVTTTGTTPSETTIKLEFSLVDVFKFDETNFIDEAKSMSQIDSFVNKLKLSINQHGKPLTDHIMKSSPKIIGYASVDGNPEQKITGKFAACKSKATRGEYDQCLSEARAKRITDTINEKLTGTGVSFGFYGAGETTKFGPGWTQQAPTKMEQTSPNRRFELSPIPPFNKVIKTQ